MRAANARASNGTTTPDEVARWLDDRIDKR
jgi:hypothetical protein